MPHFKRCIVFLADGARPDVMADQMARGNLPNLARYLVEKGTQDTIVSVFPSTTGPAYLPYLTGCYPGTCNVPGIRWFDKFHYATHGWGLKSFRSYVGFETFLMNRDVKPHIKTAFEVFSNAISIFNMINRGILDHHNKTKFSRIWYIYYGHVTDRWGFVDESACLKLLSAIDADFDFAFAVFPSIDEFSHRSSPFHPRTLQAYQELDGYIGRVIQKLKEKNELDETLLMVVADHGLSETHTHFDVGPYMEERGLKTFFYTQILKWNFEAASMISGNGMAHLYFKGKKGWKERAYFEELYDKNSLMEEFRNRPEVGLVSSQGADGSIHVLTKKGHGSFKIDQNSVVYQWDNEEPLGLPLQNSQNRTAQFTLDESLGLSFNSHFPDVFMQLSQLYRSRRTGDVILSANSGFDLRKRFEHPEHKSSHGSICPEHMKIPLLMNYHLKKEGARGGALKTRDIIRSVDLFPTILKLTGKEIPAGIDGEALV